MKILRIIARLNVGGPAIHTILLTQALNNEYYKSVLVTGRVGIGEKDMAFLAGEKGVEPIIIPELERKISPVKDVLALWKIYSIIRREKPDIVHTHTAKAGVLGRVAAILAGAPIRIHTFHGHVFDSYFNGFSASVFLSIERFLATFSKYIVVVSEAQKEEWLVKIAAGETIIVFAFAEPAGRYNLAEIRTTAKKRGAGYVLNGHKTVVIGAPGPTRCW